MIIMMMIYLTPKCNNNEGFFFIILITFNNYEGKYDKRFFILPYNSYYKSI